MGLLNELIGQILDEKYHIDKQLGQGGMGAVYRATHLGTKRPVALKVIAPQFMRDAEFVERFKREAEAAGSLRHPNVVNVTDFGFAQVFSQQVAYLVMEYLDGCTLGDKLREKGRLPLGFVVDIVEQLCLAIDKAHHQGIIHRDLKPDNIWLEPNGRGGYNIKVLDFGLAKLRETTLSTIADRQAVAQPATPTLPFSAREPDSPPAVMTTSLLGSTDEAPTEVANTLACDQKETVVMDQSSTAGRQKPHTNWIRGITRAGAVLGTPSYMSPEQCLGQKLDARSDIYSIGVITYQMLAGETPFGGDAHELLVKHVQELPPPLKDKHPDIPEFVARLVMSALAKQPAERPTNASAFATALQANAMGESALLRQALALYGEYFSTFIFISLVGFTPVIIGIAALSLGLLVPSLHTPMAISCVILLFLLSVFLYNAVIGSVVVPMAAQFLRAPLQSFQVRPALAALKPKLWAFLTTSILAHASYICFILPMILYSVCPSEIRAYLTNTWLFWVALLCLLIISAWLLRRDQMAGKWLYAPIVILEGRQGRAALARSKVLVDRLGGGLGKIFPLFVLVAVSVSVLTITLSWSLIKQFELGMSWLESVIVITTATSSILLCILLGVLFSPLMAIGISLFYLKARQAGSETLLELFQMSTEQAPLHSNR